MYNSLFLYFGAIPQRNARKQESVCQHSRKLIQAWCTILQTVRNPRLKSKSKQGGEMIILIKDVIFTSINGSNLFWNHCSITDCSKDLFCALLYLPPQNLIIVHNPNMTTSRDHCAVADCDNVMQTINASVHVNPQIPVIMRINCCVNQIGILNCWPKIT